MLECVQHFSTASTASTMTSVCNINAACWHLVYARLMDRHACIRYVTCSNKYDSCLGTFVSGEVVLCHHGLKPVYVGLCGLFALTEAAAVTGHGRCILCKAAQDQVA